MAEPSGAKKRKQPPPLNEMLRVKVTARRKKGTSRAEAGPVVTPIRAPEVPPTVPSHPPGMEREAVGETAIASPTRSELRREILASAERIELMLAKVDYLVGRASSPPKGEDAPMAEL
ncbi:uncharacterized protein LOC131225771 [Magnolia sinica]|uniref:uncharacterized protein LOC131225771 n=1 Tax=Magnolia sinica TaxID=86752 RepID=UPI002658EA22|nr:uncharacterized protein LOC131225771 [Magnolia sinica]XP_058077347.1 uncharacterized protein LOC131225771 [Magnolia sinica]